MWHNPSCAKKGAISIMFKWLEIAPSPNPIMCTQIIMLSQSMQHRGWQNPLCPFSSHIMDLPYSEMTPFMGNIHYASTWWLLPAVGQTHIMAFSETVCFNMISVAGGVEIKQARAAYTNQKPPFQTLECPLANNLTYMALLSVRRRFPLQRVPLTARVFAGASTGRLRDNSVHNLLVIICRW